MAILRQLVDFWWVRTDCTRFSLRFFGNLLKFKITTPASAC